MGALGKADVREDAVVRARVSQGLEFGAVNQQALAGKPGEEVVVVDWGRNGCLRESSCSVQLGRRRC